MLLRPNAPAWWPQPRTPEARQAFVERAFRELPPTGVAVFWDAADKTQCIQFAANESGTLVMEIDCGASGGRAFDEAQAVDVRRRGYVVTAYGNARREGVQQDPSLLAVEVEDVFTSVLRRPRDFRLRSTTAKG